MCWYEMSISMYWNEGPVIYFNLAKGYLVRKEVDRGLEIVKRRATIRTVSLRYVLEFRCV